MLLKGAGEEMAWEEMLNDDAADGEAGDDYGDANFDDGPDLGVVVFVGYVVEVYFCDVGYADDGDCYIAVFEGGGEG